MQKTIKGVIFDLDGTIANTLPLCIAAFRKTMEPLTKHPLTDDDITAMFGPTEEGTIRSLVPSYYNQAISDFHKNYAELHSMCPEPFKGITELLIELRNKGVKLAMVTGKGPRSANISLDQFGYNHYFERLETGSPDGPNKPAGLMNILNEWHDLTRDEVIYVGDAPSDIIACREVNLPIISACWAETAQPSKIEKLNPNHIFYDVPAFSRWLMNVT